jgi:hypothetical protein
MTLKVVGIGSQTIVSDPPRTDRHQGLRHIRCFFGFGDYYRNPKKAATSTVFLTVLSQVFC